MSSHSSSTPSTKKKKKKKWSEYAYEYAYFKMKYSKGMSPQITQPHFNFNEKNFAY